MRRFARRPWSIALSVLLLVLVADVIAWRVATGRLQDVFETWRDQLPAKGWQLSSAPPEHGGFPFAAKLRLAGVRFGTARPDGAAWTAESLVFGISLFHPGAITVIPSGAQTIALPGIAPWRFGAAAMEIAVPVAQPGTHAALRATRLAIGTPSGDAVAQTVALDLDWAAGGAHAVLSAGPVAMPQGHRWGLGQNIDAIGIDLIAHGAWPGGEADHAAAAWRDGGGRIDIAAASLRWGRLDVAGSGAATLDAVLQPRVSLRARIADPQAALAALAASGTISQGAATAAAAVLSLLTLPAKLQGQAGPMELPLTLSDGAVTVGRIPLTSMPRVQWR